jgi:hypothetical protein
MQVFQMFSYVCWKWFHLNVCNGYTCGFQVFPGVSHVCCQYFNCFGRMVQMFPLDVVKVDMGVAYIALIGTICCSRLLRLLGPLHVHGCGGGRCERDTVWTQMEMKRCKTRSGAGPHMKQRSRRAARASERWPPFGRPGASLSHIINISTFYFLPI